MTILGRTIGYEIECFMQVSYDDLEAIECELGGEAGSDGSLYGGEGREVEYRTKPTNDTSDILDIYNVLNRHGLNVNRTCGLHTHVDISDFTAEDYAKLMRFGKGIERIMFSLVSESRDGNEYSSKLPSNWRKIYRKSFMPDGIPFEALRDLEDLVYYINNHNALGTRMRYGRPNWLNPSTYNNTVEFRIFSATTSGELAVKFGMLAYHIVETVKHSTIGQLNFLIKSIYESTSLDMLYSRFFDGIGLEEGYRPHKQNMTAVEYLENTFINPPATNESEVG